MSSWTPVFIVWLRASCIWSIPAGLQKLCLRTWKNVKITPLYKNKNKGGDCSNYREISLLSVTGKVLAKVFLNRLQQLAELPHIVICDRCMPTHSCTWNAIFAKFVMLFSSKTLIKQKFSSYYANLTRQPSNLLLLAWQ